MFTKTASRKQMQTQPPLSELRQQYLQQSPQPQNQNNASNTTNGTTSNTTNNASSSNDNCKKARKRNEKKQKNEEPLLTERESEPLRELIMEFLESEDLVLELTDLSNTHRKFLHRFAASKGLKTRSYGPRGNRVLHIMRPKSKRVQNNVQPLELTEFNKRILDMHAVLMSRHLERPLPYIAPQLTNVWRNDGILMGTPHVPCPNRQNNKDILNERKSLPIYEQREHFLKLLNENSVVIISGETGSGKTTQIPQYLLEQATEHEQECRIIVTQPRRIAAISVANRVAMERGEQTGETVGYQIRLYSCVRRTTNLIYTTSGCFLRAIMSNCNTLFRQVTHLIIDELHERDKDTDFALITIKEQLSKNSNIKVILMSATMDIPLLSQYFGQCPVVYVPGQSYDVKMFQLEDILFHTNYRTDLMDKYLNAMHATNKAEPQPEYEQNIVGVKLDDPLQQDALDHIIDVCCQENCDTGTMYDLFEQLQYYFESENMPVDAAHSRTGITPLMVACIRNMPVYVLYLLQLNASVNICDMNGHNAYYYANQPDTDLQCLYLLHTENSAAKSRNSKEYKSKSDKAMILDAYQMQFNSDNDVDHLLILSLLEGLYRSKQPGAIMVFLPGYTDILQQRELIQSTLPHGMYRICILHGQMDTDDQNEALAVTVERKIILSTNIGQTSITIPDLVYIIDSGKVKIKTYDSVRESSQLQSVWISQADANQRAGRAGRTQNGVCYRLYSLDKYNSMSRFSIPEVMRVPLAELCLYAKTLNRQVKVQEYLAQALSPPSNINVSKAVQKLQILQIFTDDEKVTQLGKCIVELPLDVQLGKTLLYGIFLRCYPTVLTIVAFHSIKDPYILPVDRTAQGKASFLRKQFAGGSNSDQWGIVQLYNAYLDVRSSRKRVRDFCARNYLSHASMELFCTTRRQIHDVITRQFRISSFCSEYADDLNMVRFALAAGFYPNLAFVNRKKNDIISGEEKNLVLQRNSALNPPNMKNLKEFIDKLEHDWIVFYEKSRLGGSKHSISMNTLLPPLAVVLVCGKKFHIESFVESDIDDEFDDVDGDADADADADGDADVSDKHASNEALNCINGIDQQLGALRIDVATHKNNNHDNGNSTTNDNKTAPTQSMITIDNWIRFQCVSKTAERLEMLRQLIDKQFQMFLRETRLNNENNSCVDIIHQLMIGQLPPKEQQQQHQQRQQQQQQHQRQQYQQTHNYDMPIWPNAQQYFQPKRNPKWI